MKYAVDRIENNIVVLENVETKELLEIEKDKLPQDIKDGTILIYKDDEYKLDLTEEELRRKNIQNRFNSLRKKDV